MTTTTTVVYTAEHRDPSITAESPPRFSVFGCDRVEVGDPFDYLSGLDDEPPTVSESGPDIGVIGTCSSDVVVDVEDGLLRAHCGSDYTSVTVDGPTVHNARWQRVRFVF